MAIQIDSIWRISKRRNETISYSLSKLLITGALKPLYRTYSTFKRITISLIIIVCVRTTQKMHENVNNLLFSSLLNYNGIRWWKCCMSQFVRLLDLCGIVFQTVCIFCPNRITKLSFYNKFIDGCWKEMMEKYDNFMQLWWLSTRFYLPNIIVLYANISLD